MTEFKSGYCYYNTKGDSVSPRIMKCRSAFLLGKQLVPTTGLIRFPVSCDSPEVQAGEWVDCTDQVKRSLAMQNCEACPLEPITKEHIGTVIAYMTDTGRSAPCYLYSYANGIAYIMSLDGRDKLSNFKLTHCFPLQRMYTDVVNRALSTDPLYSSMFDSFFKWLRGTPQYTVFVSELVKQPEEDREDMIKLFELMSYAGITAENFEREVDRRYEVLPQSLKDALPKYAAVLTVYKTPATEYTKLEKEVMRATDFQFQSPQEAWRSIAKDKPFPESHMDLQQALLTRPRTARQYVCDKLGLYDGNYVDFWYREICPTTGQFLDVEASFRAGVDAYLQIKPTFDTDHLNFLQEDAKDWDAVFARILGNSFKPGDYVGWTENPPPIISTYRSAHPELSNVEAFREIYERRRDSK